MKKRVAEADEILWGYQERKKERVGNCQKLHTGVGVLQELEKNDEKGETSRKVDKNVIIFKKRDEVCSVETIKELNLQDY